jgi:glutamate-ammonia-ligase adenylyltransferase
MTTQANPDQTIAASLAERITAAPKLVDTRRAKSRMADLRSVLAGHADFNDALRHPMVEKLLLGIADHSPFLWHLTTIDPERIARLLVSSPEQALVRCLQACRETCNNAVDDASVLRALRKAKQESALLIALADIGGLWDVPQVTAALADFADHATRIALSYLLREAAAAGKFLCDPADPEKTCGVVVLAMGKHGARELNYSSDVDLIVFFDPESRAIPEHVDAAQFFIQVTRRLARLLQDRTEDGYVLRVDLRLRPDPGSTAVAISLPAAANYYETLGQNWERAALIKARPIAGEIGLGESFLKGLAPFIWRKYFDYAAIADIHAMKRQIHSVRGHAEVAVAGHDVKLGRGGIREVEFFVQTQQLIFGGRRPHLRGSRTLDMLRELHDDGWVTADAVKDLTDSYCYLRKIEHRLQMIADEQTQRLPAEPEPLTAFAKFCGYATLKKFEAEMSAHLRQVEKHYARLFEHAPGLDTQTGSLVFTGVTDDPETIETLSKLGFQDAPRAAETIRGWHFGRRPAVQSARAREVLTELVPALLESFSGSGDPDAALLAFDAAMARMPAAIELMTILKSNGRLRDLFADILGGAPKLANVIAQRPHVLDAAIDPVFVRGKVDEATYEQRTDNLAATAKSTEDFLDGLRDIAQEEMFLIGLRTLSQIMDPSQAGAAFSALASVIVRAALRWTEAAFAAEHGRVPGGRCIVLGLGKLGSGEMTASSDLDLILLYDFDENNPESSGARPLHGTPYYTRLTQRLVSALTVATRRGRLYEVDMRLRPSGGKGPVATQFRSFGDYQKHEAENWEHMAITRARVIAGDPSLAGEVMDIIHAAIARHADDARLRKSIFEMRTLIAQEKGDKDIWDLKLVAGGLLDIEFIAQFLAMRWSSKFPALVDVSTRATIEIAARNRLIDSAAADTLVEAHRLYTDFMQITRMIVEGVFDPAQTPEAVKRRIALLLALPDFKSVERNLADMRAGVRKVFGELLGS